MLDQIVLVFLEVAVFQSYGYLFAGPHNKDYIIFGKLPSGPYRLAFLREARKRLRAAHYMSGQCKV